jgi:hypothetical protein
MATELGNQAVVRDLLLDADVDPNIVTTAWSDFPFVSFIDLDQNHGNEPLSLNQDISTTPNFIFRMYLYNGLNANPVGTTVWAHHVA